MSKGNVLVEAIFKSAETIDSDLIKNAYCYWSEMNYRARGLAPDDHGEDWDVWFSEVCARAYAAGQSSMTEIP